MKLVQPLVNQRPIKLFGSFASWLAVAGVLVLTSTAARSEDLKPALACLPEETVFAVRLPGGQAFAEALRSRTKLGSMLFSPDRLQRLLGMLNKEQTQNWEEFQQDLKKYGLQTSDLGSLFQGEMGYAGVLFAKETPTPLLLGVGWLEPGDDLSARVLAAIEKGLEENKGEKGTPERTDLELSGQKVMYLKFISRSSKPGRARAVLEPRNRRIEPDLAPRAGGVGDKDADDDDEDQRVAVPVHVLLAKLGGRLLVAHSYPITRGEENAGDDTLEQLKGVFARLLSAHTGDQTAAHPALLEAGGREPALPAGLPLIEVLGDFRPVTKWANQAVGGKSRRVLDALGFNQLGSIGYRVALDGNVLRSGAFIAAGNPRSGLFGLLDQPPLAPQPAAWVPADVVGYEHFSFDLGQAYQRVKKLLEPDFGEQMAPILDIVEAQLKAFAQTDLATLLSSLGGQHVVVNFAATDNDGDDDTDSLFGQTNRSAFVWQLKDEALWKRILQTVAGLTGKELAEEQGFTGLRVEQPNVEVAAFVGRGYLVLGLGEDVTQSVLAALRNPPADEKSLAGSRLSSRARELLPPEPGLSYSLVDTDRQIKALRKLLAKTLDSAIEKADEDAQQDTLKMLKSLFPSEDELDGTFGVSVSQSTVGDAGLTLRSALDLPPAGP